VLPLCPTTRNLPVTSSHRGGTWGFGVPTCFATATTYNPQTGGDSVILTSRTAGLSWGVICHSGTARRFDPAHTGQGRMRRPPRHRRRCHIAFTRAPGADFTFPRNAAMVQAERQHRALAVLHSARTAADGTDVIRSYDSRRLSRIISLRMFN
jgi:hypothetical protein